MKKADIKLWTEKVEDATPEEKRSTIQTAMLYCTNSLMAIKSSMDFLSDQFRRKYILWTGQPADFLTQPVTISADHQDAKKMNYYALAGLIFEIFLSIWVFQVTLGLSWEIGGGVAILLALFVHILIFAVFRRTERPRESYRKIKKYVLFPTLFIFIPSLAILLLVRTISGPLALTLSPLFGIALWSTTISLLGLVGALFSLAHLLNWSWRDAKEYEVMASENIQTEMFYSRLADENNLIPAKKTIVEGRHD